LNKSSFIPLAAIVACSLFAIRSAAASASTADGVTKVACIGDSITFGAGTKAPRTDSYPAQLGRMLGPGFSVTNFGVSGTTLLNQGDHPYQKTGQMKRSLASNADIVVIMLGTNDTKPQNWKLKEQFVADYKNMIDQFKALPSHPKIFICLPPFVPKTGNYGINEAGVEEQMPLIRQIAADEKVEVINNYAPLKDHADLLPDNVHPNAEGATLLAKSVFAAITGKAFDDEAPPATRKSN
jgi:lysophospholipase L1-like esterase